MISPEYMHINWTDATMRQLIQERFAVWVLGETYDNYPTNFSELTHVSPYAYQTAEALVSACIRNCGGMVRLFKHAVWDSLCIHDGETIVSV